MTARPTACRRREEGMERIAWFMGFAGRPAFLARRSKHTLNCVERPFLGPVRQIALAVGARQPGLHRGRGRSGHAGHADRAGLWQRQRDRRRHSRLASRASSRDAQRTGAGNPDPAHARPADRLAAETAEPDAAFFRFDMFLSAIPSRRHAAVAARGESPIPWAGGTHHGHGAGAGPSTGPKPRPVRRVAERGLLRPPAR